VRRLALIAALGTLVIVWAGPLRLVAGHSFTAHMIMHMGVVAVAAPLLALAIADTRFDPSDRLPILLAPLPASLWELVVVWGWHAPVLHAFARGSAIGVALEQASFLAAGLVLWLACISARNAAAGIFGLLFTSMHMTLLGALLALSPRPLYESAHVHSLGMSALEDQNLGGVVMLGVGGAAYLFGGLVLMARLLNAGPSSLPGRR
jgi:putative membrane protein